MSVSGHKIHGPKGVGFLYIDERVKIRPLLYGGGQQKGMRSGTENVPGCAGLGAAVKEVYTDHEAKIERLYGLRERMIEGLKALPGVTINGHEGRENAPQIVSASFEGVRSEVLLHALEEKGIYVSSGSACSKGKKSPVLAAMGLDSRQIDSALRISFTHTNTEEDIDAFVQALKQAADTLVRRS